MGLMDKVFGKKVDKKELKSYVYKNYGNMPSEIFQKTLKQIEKGKYKNQTHIDIAMNEWDEENKWRLRHYAQKNHRDLSNDLFPILINEIECGKLRTKKEVDGEVECLKFKVAASATMDLVEDIMGRSYR